MSEVAVRVQGLGKRYAIGTRRKSSQPMLRDVLGDAVRSPFAIARGLAQRWWSEKVPPVGATQTAPDHIWALRGVSFDVERGEVVGLIGPNGAGKSTLLKILSRITEPTEGRVEIHGRVASLLEVGTGFHPELTGRENIYLSGALLGMRKTDIDRNLEEIIDFSGIEKFIDTPVKHYSSGMYVRLAFAVAAHLESDVLIVDEVLAVGDAAFQRKCLAKMEDVHQHGRTILFVSHNMPAVTRLCQRALLICDGTVQKDGPAQQIASAYLLSSLSLSAERAWPDPTTAPGDHIARLRRVRIKTEDGVTVSTVDIRRPVGIEMVYDVLTPGHVLTSYYDIFNDSGVCIFVTHDLDPTWRRRPRPVGTFSSTAWIPGNLLADGPIVLGAALLSKDPFRIHFHDHDTVAVQIVDSFDGDAARGEWERPLAGIVRPLLKWTTQLGGAISRTSTG
jgi:lipopolysaccharide transport system ATP-binding protein